MLSPSASPTSSTQQSDPLLDLKIQYVEAISRLVEDPLPDEQTSLEAILATCERQLSITESQRWKSTDDKFIEVHNTSKQRQLLTTKSKLRFQYEMFLALQADLQGKSSRQQNQTRKQLNKINATQKRLLSDYNDMLKSIIYKDQKQKDSIQEITLSQVTSESTFWNSPSHILWKHAAMKMYHLRERSREERVILKNESSQLVQNLQKQQSSLVRVLDHIDLLLASSVEQPFLAWRSVSDIAHDFPSAIDLKSSESKEKLSESSTSILYGKRSVIIASLRGVQTDLDAVRKHLKWYDVKDVTPDVLDEVSVLLTGQESEFLLRERTEEGGLEDQDETDEIQVSVE